MARQLHNNGDNALISVAERWCNAEMEATCPHRGRLGLGNNASECPNLLKYQHKKISKENFTNADKKLQAVCNNLTCQGGQCDVAGNKVVYDGIAIASEL